MKEYLKRTVEGMRQELTEFLPQSLLAVVEPKDVLRMHQYKIGNELIMPFFPLNLLHSCYQN